LGKRITKEQINLRFNMTTLLVYIFGAILIIQLLNLQIVHGEDYREQSNTRLTRISEIEGSRGDILDRSGNKLATVRVSYNIELYKTNIETEELNNAILELINVLQKNEENYTDTFPIKINPFGFTISEKKLSTWKEKYDLEENITAEQAFYKFKDKYKITNESIEEARKIIGIRYRITTEGYSSTKSIEIATDIKQETVAELSEKSSKFAGVNIVEDSIRTYTSGSLASHIIGYIGSINEDEYKQLKDAYDRNDIIGKTGVESLFEDYLKGENGEKQIDMAVDGTITAEYVSEEAIAGSSVVLTIDSNLQRVAEEALKNTINKIASGGFSETINTTAGSVVVMKVDTGEILAMASYPDFEPEKFVGGISTSDWNSYRDNEDKPLLNRAIQSSYAPGSIFKMVTATAGLETGAITIGEKINDTGVYRYYQDKQPECWIYSDYRRGHGYLNVTGAIKNSCNYYFYELGRRMGIDTLSKYAKYFGLGEKTGIELPSESSGTLASRETKAKLMANATSESAKQWTGGETLSAAIGQSYNNFTPLQMAKYISTLVNGGKEVNPTIIKTILNADGTEETKEEIEKYSNEKLGIANDENEEILEIKPENLSAILEGMRSVTSETGGTAYSVFKNFNIEVGGKTGSAQAGDGNVNAWFTGFAPFNAPEVVVVAMVEKGAHGSYTGEMARDILAEYFGINSRNIEETINAVPYTEQER
jgi:penicillin-binding protein 2